MAVIRVERDKAERMVAQILRDEQKIPPAQANTIAANICKRLQLAMETPTKPGLRYLRLIPHWPPDEAEFAKTVGEKLADIDERLARVLWEMVFDRCAELPDDVVP